MPKKDYYEAIVIVFAVAIEDGDFFHRAKGSLSMILQRKLLTPNNKDDLALIVVGDVDAEIKYDLQAVNWEMTKFVNDDMQPAAKKINWWDALEKALHILQNSNASQKRLILFFNYSSDVSDSQLNLITDSIEGDSIDLTMIGPDFLSNLLEEEPEKKKQKLSSEASETIDIVTKIHNVVGFFMNKVKKLKAEIPEICQVCPIDAAVRHLFRYVGRQKTKQPTPWNCLLDIGDIEIAISAYLKTKKQTGRIGFESVLPASDIPSDNDPSLPSTSYSSQISKSRSLSKAYVDSQTGDTKKESVDPENTIRAYEYGCTVVPFSDADKMSLYKPGKKCLSILCFVEAKSIHRHYLMGDGTYVIVPRRGDEHSETALSALIQALDSLSRVGIARKVYAQDKGLRIVALTPSIEETEDGSVKECLLMHELPFKEDVTDWNDLIDNKTEVTEEEAACIDELIDSMDLMTANRDSNGAPCEAFEIDSLCDRKSQFYQYCIAQRKLYPEKPLPKDLPDEFKEINFEIPKSIREGQEKAGEKINKIFQFQNIAEKKGKFKRNRRGIEEEEENEEAFPMQIDEEIVKPPSHTIKNEDEQIVNDFKNLFNEKGYPPGNGLLKVINLFVKDEEQLNQIFDVLLEIFLRLREFSVENYPEKYNNMLMEIKENCPTGGPILNFLKNRLNKKAGLITSEESATVDVSPEAAANFFNEAQSFFEVSAIFDKEGDDLLAELF